MKLVILSVLFIFSFPSWSEDSRIICQENSFHCLSKNVQKLYASNYSRFFSIYHAGFDKALKCKNVNDMKQFLVLGTSRFGNAEVDESLNEDIETLLLLNSRCFFDGVLQLKDTERLSLFNNYSFFARGNSVMDALLRYQSIQKYKVPASEFIRAKSDSWKKYWKDKPEEPIQKLKAKYGL